MESWWAFAKRLVRNPDGISIRTEADRPDAFYRVATTRLVEVVSQAKFRRDEVNEVATEIRVESSLDPGNLFNQPNGTILLGSSNFAVLLSKKKTPWSAFRWFPTNRCSLRPNHIRIQADDKKTRRSFNVKRMKASSFVPYAFGFFCSAPLRH